MKRTFDRLVRFDERSRKFGIIKEKKKKNRSYTWRCNQVLDQGSDGACVGFGMSHNLIARPAEVQGITNQFAKENIYWEAQKIDPWKGGAYPSALPFYEGTSVLAGVQIAHKLGYFDEYRWGFSLDDLIYGVGHNGPAIMGTNWYEDMSNLLTNYEMKPTGNLQGGHCYLVVAVNVKQEFFTVLNSWGSSWGFNGRALISFDNMKKLLMEDGEQCFTVKNHQNPKPITSK